MSCSRRCGALSLGMVAESLRVLMPICKTRSLVGAGGRAMPGAIVRAGCQMSSMSHPLDSGYPAPIRLGVDRRVFGWSVCAGGGPGVLSTVDSLPSQLANVILRCASIQFRALGEM